MSDFYEIPDPKYYNGESGTLQQPHLLKITYGQKFKNSLNFHCKIGKEFFIYRLRCINRKIRKSFYIVSILMKYENRTFSYPVALSLMRGRTADAYREFFGHLAQIFEQKNHRPLRIPKILSDAEAAIFRPINEIFPNTTLKLCKVHLLRNWRKK